MITVTPERYIQFCENFVNKNDIMFYKNDIMRYKSIKEKCRRIIN